MTEIPTPDFIDVYREQRQVISGVAFFLIPYKKGQIVWTRLMETLKDKSDTSYIDVEELQNSQKNEKLIIPEVFKDKGTGKLVLRTSIDKITLTGSSLFGKITFDKPLEWTYRGYRIFIIATTEIHFLVCQDEQLKRVYLVILGSRANSKSTFDRINNFLITVGLYAVPAGIAPSDVEAIRESLNGELLDTTLDGFSTPKIKLVRIVGKGFENEESYLNDKKRSSIHQHMFAYSVTSTDGKSHRKVITLSEDALLRFYTNATYSEYEWFLRRHIFPTLKQIEKPPAVPLTGFTASVDIFEDVSEEEEE
jgi:hypothetical protein